MTDPFSVLPVKDAVIASDFSQRPVAQVDSEVALYEPEPVKEKQFNLRPLQLHFGEYLRYHARAKEANEWKKQFKHILPGVVADASLMVMGDLPVATFRHDARLSLSRLEKEQPHLVAKYTRMVTRPEFDEEAFRKDMFDVWVAYRGRSFRLVNAGAGAGLVLPA